MPGSGAVSTSNAFAVTEEKVAQVVDRLIANLDPLKIIAFGSRAIGNAVQDSDLDLAVIVEDQTKTVDARRDLGDLRMPVDLLIFDSTTHDKFRTSVNSVHNHIEKEGIVLYDKAVGSPSRVAIEQVGRGRSDHSSGHP